MTHMTRIWAVVKRFILWVVLMGLAVTTWVCLPSESQAERKFGYSLTSYLKCSRDAVLLEALQHMDEADASRATLRWLVDAPVRVVFKDMGTLARGLENYDALSWISAQGEQVVFINRKHQTAPPEALAAMLSHEALHNDIYNSVNEEVAGWRQEALVWGEMKRLNPALSKIPTGFSPLVDRENRIEKEYAQGTLEAFVKGNAGYRGLPENSPGFGGSLRTSRIAHREEQRDARTAHRQEQSVQ